MLGQQEGFALIAMRHIRQGIIVRGNSSKWAPQMFDRDVRRTSGCGGNGRLNGEDRRRDRDQPSHAIRIFQSVKFAAMRISEG